jgi:NAD+ kinase
VPAPFPQPVNLAPKDFTGRIAFFAAATEVAAAAKARLVAQYGDAPLGIARAVVSLGGDGCMLETQHRLLGRNLPVYGMNCGSVGFLMNDYREEALHERLAEAQAATLHPLRMRATSADGTVREAPAINEVSLLRETRQAAKIRILVDGKERLAELICDGVLVATPAGSTAYNLSAHGPDRAARRQPPAADAHLRLPPRALARRAAAGRCGVVFEILEARSAPVAAVADYTEVRDVRRVEVREDRGMTLTLLFDPTMG